MAYILLISALVFVIFVITVSKGGGSRSEKTHTGPTPKADGYNKYGTVRSYRVQGTLVYGTDKLEVFWDLCQDQRMGLLLSSVSNYEDILNATGQHFREISEGSDFVGSSFDMRLFCAKCCHAYTVGELLQLSTIGESFGLSGGNCSKCSAGDAFFFYDNWKPDSVDNSDIEALKQYWKYKVQEFNIFIHSEEGQCMECGREVDIDTAYVKESGHGSGKLICRACVDKYLGANILDELREDPHYIGRSVLRNARNFVNGQYNHKLIEEMKTVSSTESKSTAPKESTNTIKKSTGDDSNVDIRWGKTLTYDHPFINPKTAIGFVGRGDSYAEKGEYDLAISDYSKALELNPLDPMFVHAYFNRGVAYFQKGKYNQAIADFTKVIEIKPTDADARFRRAAAYLFKGEYDKAWEDVHKAQNLGCQVNAKFLKVLREASGRER